MKLIDLLRGKKKKLPQLGGSNPQNIDAMVAAGDLTPEEGEILKKKFKKAREKQGKKRED